MLNKLIAILIAIGAVLGYMAYSLHKKLQLEEGTRDGLIALLNLKTSYIEKANGERLAMQEKIMVDRQTFNSLMNDKVKGWEQSTGVKLGRINSIVEATYSTVRKGRATGRDTVMVFSSDTSVHKKDTVVVFNFSDKWGTEKIIVKDKEAIRIDSTTNRIAVIESKEKWKLKHLWQKRKNRISLLIFNPNSRIDTLRNLEVLEK